MIGSLDISIIFEVSKTTTYYREWGKQQSTSLKIAVWYPQNDSPKPILHGLGPMQSQIHTNLCDLREVFPRNVSSW